MNYINEFDPFAAQWCRNLSAAGHISESIVDERSITDVNSTDLMGYEQCHFFGGIGGWPLALRLAGYEHLEGLWTGSCPCQPFSSAGKQKGTSDARHLWPVFFNLIRQCRPKYVFGEQVASSEVVGTELEAAFVSAVQNGDNAKANRFAEKIEKKQKGDEPSELDQRWFDMLASDLESIGYEVAGAVLTASCIGAPHIRSRLYWGAFRRYAVLVSTEHNIPQREGNDGSEEMQQMQDEKAAGYVRSRKEGSGWSAIRMQGVPKGETSRLSSEEQGSEKRGGQRMEDEKPRDRQGIRFAISDEICVAGNAASCAQEGGEVQMEVRFGRPSRGIQDSRGKDDMRDDRNALGSRGRCRKSGEEVVEHSIDRQDRSSEGIYDQQHSDRLLGDELRNVDMGRRSAVGSDEVVDSKEVNDVAAGTDNEETDVNPVGNGFDGIPPTDQHSYDTGGSNDIQDDSIRSPHIRQRLWWGFVRNDGLPDSGSDRYGGPTRTEAEIGEAGRGSQWSPRSELHRQLPDGPEGLADNCGPGTGGLYDANGTEFQHVASAGQQSLCELDAGHSGLRESGPVERCEVGGSGSGLQHTESDGRDQRRPESSGGSIASGCGGMANSSSSGRRPQSHQELQSAGKHWNGPWSDYTIAEFRDGKRRRVGSEYVQVVDGASRGMGLGQSRISRVGGNSEHFNEEQIDAETTSRITSQALSSLQDTTNPQDTGERTDGGNGRAATKDLLQSRVHGSRNGRGHESGERAKLPSAIVQGCAARVSKLRQESVTDVRSSHRRESVEQFRQQFENIVRLLPSSMSLAELRGDWTTAKALYSLQSAIHALRVVPETSISTEEAWRSLTDEEKNRIAVCFGERNWRIVGCGPLEPSIPRDVGRGQPELSRMAKAARSNRTGRLKGYGNAIVPQVAAVFIQAFMESIR